MQQLADLPAILAPDSLEVTGRIQGTDVKLSIDTTAERTVLTKGMVSARLLAHAAGRIVASDKSKRLTADDTKPGGGIKRRRSDHGSQKPLHLPHLIARVVELQSDARLPPRGCPAGFAARS